MDCKILKKTLFISILAISLFYTGEVRAEGPIKAQGCTSKLVSETKITRSDCKITVNGLRATANFYEFKVGDNLALCLNPGKKMKNGLKYSLESITPVSNTLIQKAYTYARDHSDDLAARIAAQTVVWYVSLHGNIINEEEIEKAICSAIISGKKSGSKCSGSLTETCTGAWQNIQNTVPRYTVYYYRVYDDKQTTEYQRLVSTLSATDLETYIRKQTGKINGKDYSLDVNVNLQEFITTLGIPDYETTCKGCDLLVESDLADCGDYNSKVDSNSGRVYQKITGVCKSGYKTESEAKVTLDGTIAKTSGDGNYWNIRCLESLVQTYPGNIRTAINVGRYIVWPNNNLNEIVKKANLQSYKMMLAYEKSCKININSEEYKKDYSTYRNNMEKESVRSSITDNNQKEYVNTYTDPTTHTVIDPLDNVINYVINKESCQEYTTAASNASLAYWGNAAQNIPGCFATYCDPGTDGQCRWTNGNCNDKEKDLNRTAALSNACNNYLTNYNGAKKVLKSFKNIISEANSFNSISIDNFEAKFTVNYNDSEWGTSYDLFQINGDLSKENLGNIAVSNIPDKPNNVTVQTFNGYFNPGSYADQAQSVTAKISRFNYYDLNQKTGLPSTGTTRAYIKKNDLKIKNKEPQGNNKNRYSTVGFVNMPISFSADKNMPSEGYELSLKLNELKSSSMNSEIKNTILNHNYTCHYKVVKEPPTPCECPENSNAPGRNLTCEINSWNENHKEKITCPDGQTKWCYTNNASSEDEICRPERFVCPEDSDTPGYDLSTCINSGGTYETCKTVCFVKCPSSSNATDEMSDKFRNCVSKYVNQGVTINDAKQKCNNYCKFPNYGSTIIYRTISLTNPFPSYNADDTITQNIKKGMFSSQSESTFSGRYPGYNWNGVNVVTRKILKNRNVSDNKVYNKSPLYKFVLDGQTIKEIRKYNSNQKKNNKGGYADFTLKCYKNHSSACVSSFVHNATYGLKGGKCSINLNANKNNVFYTCAEQWDGD